MTPLFQNLTDFNAILANSGMQNAVSLKKEIYSHLCHVILLSVQFLACQVVATEIRIKIEEFRPFIPLIRGLGNSGMRSRHWELLSERINVNVKLKANLNFSQCLELGLQDHVEEITRVAQEAGKEFAIEQVSNSSAENELFYKIFIS